MATTHIVLLRGINVGRSNRIGMAPLRQMLEELGYTGVRTLLNSGNAVVTAPASSPSTVARQVEAAIEQTFGLSIAVVVRSRADVERVIERNPIPEGPGEPKQYHVGFCDPAPDPRALDALDHDALAPERAVLDGDTLYLWFARGLQNSPLNKELDRLKLQVTVTMRNWNTVRKLVDLADE